MQGKYPVITLCGSTCFKDYFMEAQVYATGYYAKEGFEVVSDEFMEGGIPHVKMERTVL